MNNEYKYSGKPFTAKIAAELILELCKGETLKKVEIRNRVYEYHKEQGGGEFANPNTLDQCFNDALNRDLKQKRHLADNKSRGIWTIYGMPPIDDPPEEPTVGCVYIYYYPSYRELAELKGKDKWPCKIGRTETDDPNSLEQTIRSLLKRKGMHIQGAPGDEWYLINSEIAKKVAEAFEDFQKKLDFI